MRLRNRGFTLIELMATLATLAITLCLGMPALGSLMERTRITNAYHVMTTSLMAARLAAITRGERVTVCPSRDGRTCRGDQVWETGWIIFADPRRTGQPSSAEAILRRLEPLEGQLVLRSSRGRPRVRYLPSGRAHGSNISLCLYVDSGQHLIGRVAVNNSGRARSERSDDLDSCPSAV